VVANGTDPVAFAGRYSGVTVAGYFDGNLANGDYCSATCQMVLPAGCALVSPTLYQSAYGNDPVFKSVMARANALGFGPNPSFQRVARCQVGGGVPMYFAVLTKPTPTTFTDYAVIRSRLDVPAPYTTMVYYSINVDQSEMLFDHGSFRQSAPDVYGNSDIELRDNDGLLWPPDYPPPTHNTHPTCGDRIYNYFACELGDLVNEVTTCSYALIETRACTTLGILSVACIVGFEVLPGPWNFITQCAQALTAGCAWPRGQSCRTEACRQGTCVDNVLGFGVSCVENVPVQYLCDTGCEICSSTSGCQSRCGVPCMDCNHATHMCENLVPPGEPRWARVKQSSRNQSAPPCNCDTNGNNCSCGASSVVDVAYYGCTNPPTLTPELGRCSTSSMDHTSTATCGAVPLGCNPFYHWARAWEAYNVCGASCSVPGLDPCALENRVRGPLKVGTPVDLRTPREVAAHCCEQTPP